MFNSYRKAFLYLSNVILRTSTTPKLPIILQSNPSTFSLKYSTSTSDSQSFTVDYLIKKFGFSPETALSATKRVHFDNSKKPDSVITLFKSHGFSNAQISNIIRREPNLLISDPDKTILPKFEFFRSKGASRSDIIQIFTADPSLLARSLEGCFIPFYESLKRFLLSDQCITKTVKYYTHIVGHSHRTTHNVQVLLDNGMPDKKIAFLLSHWPRAVDMQTDVFKKVVDDLKELGMEPSKSIFLVALLAKSSGKTTWERKIDLFKRWGWSEEVIVSTFTKYPWIMLVSEGKLAAVKDYSVTRMGWDSMLLARYPNIFSRSLEKSIIPRHSVLQVLVSRGLIEDDKSFSPFRASEKAFRQRYVNCFKEEAPELLKLYEEKRNLSQ
ncbi:hypothetical protein L6164_012569 [Bauhinia variegata]|uniref:Uncharacterized protein n=1 Tax=Bauhinia variegata TaxID=167791 RepID=A0ACB9PAS5_BAUVA|nr:hypothetical protein L6164_012569 [Bauhinia variegata]